MVDSLKIDEQNPDVQDIMRQIQAYIAERKLDDSGSSTPVQRLEGYFSPEVYDHLFQAISTSDQISVQVEARPVRVPIFGPLLTRIREMVHGLVIFYLSQMAARQIRFNSHVVRTLKALVQDLDDAEHANMDPTRISEIGRRLAVLESQLGNSGRSADS